jgi:hypothetical protein
MPRGRKAGLQVQLSTGLEFSAGHVDSLEIGDRTDTLALLAYVGRGSLHNPSLVP